jgi:hypothetical protein
VQAVASVDVNDLGRVDEQLLVRVHGHEDVADARLKRRDGERDSFRTTIKVPL